MRSIAEGIAFASLVTGCTTMELFGGDDGAGALWVLVVVWAICTDWGKAK